MTASPPPSLTRFKDPPLSIAPGPRPWQIRLYKIIFLADSPAGRYFDLALIGAIVLSLMIVMADSVSSMHARWQTPLLVVEWILTLLFTVEYALRLACVSRARAYVFSFYGLVDLLAVLPTYLGILFPGYHYLLSVRSLRLLRIFRILRLVNYIEESRVLTRALWTSRHKISLFFFAVSTLAIILGSLMYVIEGPGNGFSSIPRSIYWAVVTITTVGYGDIAPVTPLGQAISALAMFMGYAIIAVPTGIISSEMYAQTVKDKANQPEDSQLTASLLKQCPQCDAYLPIRAAFCMQCGTQQNEDGEPPNQR